MRLSYCLSIQLSYWWLVAKSCLPVGSRLPGSSVHGISSQEYWSGLPFPSPEDLLDLGIKPAAPTFQVDSSLRDPGNPKSSNKIL